MAKSTFLLSMLIPAALMTGCAAHVGYRSYNPAYYDRQAWGPGERPYYDRWMYETHRRPTEYQRLRREEQREYWRWRHDRRDYR